MTRHLPRNPVRPAGNVRLTMPRRNLLTPAERAALLAFPTSDDELTQHCTCSEPDLSVIR